MSGCVDDDGNSSGDAGIGNGNQHKNQLIGIYFIIRSK